MACRAYPSPEGIVAPDGHPYPVLPQNFIRPELADFMLKLKEECDDNRLWLIIHSFNHGKHTPNSCHYRGIAVDCDFKEPNGGIYDWMPIDKEAAFVCSVAVKLGLDVWTYAECDHLHFSIHPTEYSCDPSKYVNTNSLGLTYG
jgi:hypothetical protein